MNCQQVLDKWKYLSDYGRQRALHTLVDLIYDIDPDDPGLEALLIHGINIEADDGFGTEGADL